MRLAPLPFMSYFTAYVVYVTYLLYWCITYRGLSEAYSKRRNDLNTILSQVEDALTNVESFTDQLSSELQELEYVSQLKQ